MENIRSSASNTIAIITGVAGNLGQAVVNKFLIENYFVEGTVRKDASVTIDVNENKFCKTEVDLSDEAAVNSFVTNVISKHKKIDIAVLTAGGFAIGNIADATMQDINHQLQLNFATAYTIARLVFLQMLKQDYGRIFLIGSRAGLQAANNKGMIAYGLSKSLLFRLAELMNEEAKGKNVTVNIIVPEIINTPQNRSSMPDADFNKWVTPKIIADVIYWYCTNEATALKENIIKIYGNG